MNDKLSGFRLVIKNNFFLLVFACLLTAMLNASITAQRKVRKAPARQLEQTDNGGASKEKAAPDEEREPVNVKSKPIVVMVTDIDARGILQWWKGNWNIGNLFSNSIIGPLSRVEQYEVVERARTKAIFDEQGLTESERFSQPKITKIGRLLGADYILFGDLQDFSRKKGKNPLIKETQVSIRLTARLVSVATGKVFKSTEVTYLSAKDKDYFSFSDKDVNPNDPEFLQSIFGKAITEAAAQTVSQLTGEGTNTTTVTSTPPNKNDSSKKSSAAAGDDNGLIADVTGSTVVINLGSQNGVKSGNQFAVVQVVKEIRDPKNPEKIIFKKTEELARIKITKVENTASEGVLISGKIESLKVGTEVVRAN